MTGKHLGVGRQREHPVAHALHQRVVVASGEIPAAKGAGEELITGEQDALVRQMETAVTRGVSGSVHYIDAESSHVESLAMGQLFEVLRRQEVTVETEQCTYLAGWIEREVVVVGVDVRRRPGSPDDLAGSSHMVDVAVSDEQCNRRQIVLLEQAGDTVGMGRSVDDDREAAALRR